MEVNINSNLKETMYMSKEYTNCMRGIFAILVVVHHLYQYTGFFRGSYIGIGLQLLGFVSVAMFFFFSGYGLMFSSEKKGYIDQFFLKRFLPLYSFYVFLIVFYSLWKYVVEGSFSIELILQSFIFGKTVVTNGWYFQTTFIAYLLYFFVFKLFKSLKMRIFFFSFGVLIYCVFCWLLKFGINKYQTIPCMVLGMLYCFCKNNIDKLLKKYSWAIFVLFIILFLGSCALSSKSGVDVIFDVLYSAFFVCAMIALSYILSNTMLIKNKFTSLCGKYSLEIYVTHGLFLNFMKLGYIKNVYLYILIVVIGTIIGSILLKKVYEMITLLFQKIVR